MASKEDQNRWKQAQLERERAALAKHGGKKITFLTYGSTLAKLEKICDENGFTGKQRIGEALTFLVENYKS